MFEKLFTKIPLQQFNSNLIKLYFISNTGIISTKKSDIKGFIDNLKKEDLDFFTKRECNKKGNKLVISELEVKNKQLVPFYKIIAGLNKESLAYFAGEFVKCKAMQDFATDKQKYQKFISDMTEVISELKKKNPTDFKDKSLILNDLISKSAKEYTKILSGNVEDIIKFLKESVSMEELIKLTQLKCEIGGTEIIIYKEEITDTRQGLLDQLCKYQSGLRSCECYKFAEDMIGIAAKFAHSELLQDDHSKKVCTAFLNLINDSLKIDNSTLLKMEMRDQKSNNILLLIKELKELKGNLIFQNHPVWQHFANTELKNASFEQVFSQHPQQL